MTATPETPCAECADQLRRAQLLGLAAGALLGAAVCFGVVRFLAAQ